MIRDIGYLKILKTGPGTSVQDMGRHGFAAFGVPVSGVLDSRSSSWVNYLLQNKDSDAVLEICQPGLVIQFGPPCLICLAGADAAVQLNGEAVPGNGLLEIQANDRLEIGKFHRGTIFYLGIKNGFQSEEALNSRSWFEGITAAAFAKKSDLIPYFITQKAPFPTTSRAKLDHDWYLEQAIEAYPGPEWELLDKKNRERIEAGKFTISDLKNRMAVQLTELLPDSIPEMATAPVFPGTVQLTPGGKLLVLMKDAQVTGGYPRILQLSEASLSRISQKHPTDQITFKLKKP